MALVQKSLQRIGNSTGLVLPSEILQEAGLQRDDEILVHAEKGRITITRLDPDFDRMMEAADRFVSAHPNAIRKLAQ